MSEPKGILSAIAQPIGEEIAQHLNAPPLRKNQNRAVWGTMFLTFGVYVGYSFYLIGRAASLPELVRGYFRALHAPLDDSWAFYAWGAVMLFSLLWIAVGLRGSRGPRDIMGAFWAFVWLAVFAAALWYGWYLDDSPLVDWFLKGFYIAFVAMAAMHVFLCVRGPGRGAAHLVQQQIAQQSRRFRIGRRRSF
jgi:hypothetical protein